MHKIAENDLMLSKGSDLFGYSLNSTYSSNARYPIFNAIKSIRFDIEAFTIDGSTRANFLSLARLTDYRFLATLHRAKDYDDVESP